jgi:uncharacterized protein YigE (DUF2233 family)
MRIPGVSWFVIGFCLPGALTADPVKKQIDGVTYHILRAPAAAVRVIWKDDGGTQLRTFPEVVAYLERGGAKVEMLMNGGIFEPGGVPSGLLIQSGRELRPVNRRPGKGNFFLLPNGIFLIGAEGAAVIRTDEFVPGAKPIRHAVQSGPLLMRKGKVHPQFNAGSASRLHRNGVGVAKNGEVVLVMSDFHSPKFPNLFEFAEAFRSLGCEDALFLDGDISQMRWGAEINQPGNRFGSFIAVVGK